MTGIATGTTNSVANGLNQPTAAGQVAVGAGGAALGFTVSLGQARYERMARDIQARLDYLQAQRDGSCPS